MVHAYMVRADEEALADGERLLRLYGDELAKEYKQTQQIVDDLKRRQKTGAFGKSPDKSWPDGFDSWTAAKKAAWLIDSLDEVDAKQMGQPGGVDLAGDRRVEALIRLGDATVPALLDAFEKDDRLTRSVHFWRDFARSRTVMTVREAELTALMSILQVQFFKSASTGDNFTARGESVAKATAEKLREYWKMYGALPFDERMMKVLSDPKASFERRREAAVNLATLNRPRSIGTTAWTTGIRGGEPGKENAAIAKFKNPTTAEAMMAAMVADLAAFDKSPPEVRTSPENVRIQVLDYQRSQIEQQYLGSLRELGDKRAAELVARRAGEASFSWERSSWASVAKSLGDPKPFQSFAKDFAAGKVEPMETQAEQANLTRIVTALVADGSPEADRALS
jgi:hypothetical protein